jgi:hypothetical protein
VGLTPSARIRAGRRPEQSCEYSAARAQRSAGTARRGHSAARAQRSAGTARRGHSAERVEGSASRGQRAGTGRPVSRNLAPRRSRIGQFQGSLPTAGRGPGPTGNHTGREPGRGFKELDPSSRPEGPLFKEVAHGRGDTRPGGTTPHGNHAAWGAGRRRTGPDANRGRAGTRPDANRAGREPGRTRTGPDGTRAGFQGSWPLAKTRTSTFKELGPSRGGRWPSAGKSRARAAPRAGQRRAAAHGYAQLRARRS